MATRFLASYFSQEWVPQNLLAWLSMLFKFDFKHEQYCLMFMSGSLCFMTPNIVTRNNRFMIRKVDFHILISKISDN
jgi:hypothetical protein